MPPEYRRCPLTDRVVILAPDRADRPVSRSVPHADCPFCPGNEHQTPVERYAVRTETGWRVRVVDNKFPAVLPGSQADGRHEVVIDSSEHVVSPVDFSASHLGTLFGVYRDRMRALLADPSIVHVTVFKNVGPAAGATVAHAHSQIVATPFVPAEQRDEVAAAARYHARFSRCFYCELYAEPRRRVLATDDFLVMCPPAPRFAYEVWVVPRQHAGRFERLSDAHIRSLGETVQRVLLGLDRLLPAVAFNWYIHTGGDSADHYHWHLELTPRTATPAGFEWASGVFVNTMPPELAAAAFRDTLSL